MPIACLELPRLLSGAVHGPRLDVSTDSPNRDLIWLPHSRVVNGVAVNSRGHVFVFSRSNSATGLAFGAAAAQLFEFDENAQFVREIGKDLYAWSEAHSVRSMDSVTGGLNAVPDHQ